MVDDNVLSSVQQCSCTTTQPICLKVRDTDSVEQVYNGAVLDSFLFKCKIEVS